MKVYLNEFGYKTYVANIPIYANSNWCTVKENKKGVKSRICSINLPIVNSKEEAQKYLDAFAAKRNWRVFEDKESKND